MTKFLSSAFTELALKILITVLLAVSSYVLSNAANELRSLQSEIKGMRIEYLQKISELTVEVVALRTRFDYHEKIQ